MSKDDEMYACGYADGENDSFGEIRKLRKEVERLNGLHCYHLGIIADFEDVIKKAKKALNSCRPDTEDSGYYHDEDLVEQALTSIAQLREKKGNV